jgi:hypothetical protein
MRLAFIGIQEDEMPTTLNPTCPLCRLLELHIRDDHRHGARGAEPDHDDLGDARRKQPRGRAEGER